MILAFIEICESSILKKQFDALIFVIKIYNFYSEKPGILDYYSMLQK